jgi:hypothetical protein
LLDPSDSTLRQWATLHEHGVFRFKSMHWMVSLMSYKCSAAAAAALQLQALLYGGATAAGTAPCDGIPAALVQKLLGLEQWI